MLSKHSKRLLGKLPKRIAGPIRLLGYDVLEGVVNLQYWIEKGAFPSGVRVRRPIFMVGCPRSGTSVAVQIFGRHPEIANWSEAGRFWDPIGYSNSEADHEWGAERATLREIERLHHRFEYVRRRLGKPRFINKHPRNSLRLEFLDEVFPDAVFVHVIRDGRAVARSIVERLAHYPNRPQYPLGQFCRPRQWRELRRENPLEEAILLWQAVVEHVRAKGARLGPRYHEFRYEDLCAEPNRVLQQAFRFTGVKADAALVASLSRGLENRNEKAAQRLTASELATLEMLAGGLLAQLGY